MNYPLYYGHLSRPMTQIMCVNEIVIGYINLIFVVFVALFLLEFVLKSLWFFITFVRFSCESEFSKIGIIIQSVAG